MWAMWGCNPISWKQGVWEIGGDQLKTVFSKCLSTSLKVTIDLGISRKVWNARVMWWLMAD